MVKIVDLKNEAKLLLAPRKETNAVTLLVMFRVGSREENKTNNGISHFIEHLFFKGTKKRPNTKALSQALDKVGANFNAFTGKDYTGYYIKISKDKITVAFDILSDMIFNSLFKKNEIEREKGVIIEEIRMYRDNPLLQIGFLIESLVYQGHSLAFDEGGPEKVIAKLTRQEILEYKNKHYYGKNMLIGVSGNFSESKAKQLVNKYFIKKYGQEVVYQRQPWQGKQTKPRIKTDYKKTEQVQMALAFTAPGPITDDYLPALLLSIILGGNMSSRLFINVRERHGLAYSVRAGIDQHQDVSTFYVQAGLNRSKIDLAYKLIIKELKNLCSQKVEAAELKKAKDYLKGKLDINLEDSFDYIYWLIKQYLDHHKIKSLKQVKAEIDNITSQQINQAAKNIFQQDKLNLAVIGPYKKSTYFNKLINKEKL